MDRRWRALLLFAALLTAAQVVWGAQTGAAAAHGGGTVIDGWSAGGELSPTTFGGASPVQLRPGSSELVVFWHKEGADPTPVLFRYRLRGFADNWTETRDHDAHFWKLPPGTYEFDVQTPSANGSWPASSATLPVRQEPFFYQTWYAVVMVCAFLLAVGLQLLRQSEQMLKGQMGLVLEERNRIASECHDTLMAGFAAVSWQLEATADLLDQKAPAENATAASLELARSMVSHCQAEARRIIWDLRNSDRITTRLSEALADAIDAHRMREGTATTLTVQGDEINLSPTAVHHLTCIGQEALTNAIRHAQSSHIQVRLQYESELLRLSVHDDGCGFAAQDAQTKAGHFGIPVMEERTRKLGGHFRLTSSAAKGTEVVVTVHFNDIHQPSVEQAAVLPWIGL